MADGRRAARVKDRIRAELMRSLRTEIRDPRVQNVLVTRVEMGDDLQIANVYIRLELGGDDAKARKTALAGLTSSAGRLRRAMGTGLKLRFTPDVRFFYDDTPDALTRVEELLHEIKKDTPTS